MQVLSGKLVVNVLTAVNEDAPQQITVLTVDFDGVTEEQAKALILRSVKIDKQRQWRKADGGIPATDTVKVKDLLVSVKQEVATVAGTAARAKTLSVQEQQDLIKMLQESLKQAKAA